jgi:hypothetical protein
MYYFLGTSWLDRSIAAIRGKRKVDRWWGGAGWLKLKGLKPHERSEIMCRRFTSELNYRYSYGWPIMSRKNGGKTMYCMMHASDHDDAPKLMARAFRFATGSVSPEDQLKFEFQLKRMRKIE